MGFRIDVDDRNRAMRFRCDRRAGVALIFGIGLPVLLTLIAGGVELAKVAKTKRELQWDVDTAALNGAREFGTDRSTATALRAQEFAVSLAAKSTPRWSIATTAEADAAQDSLTVSQTAWRASFFGSLLPPGGWRLAVSGTAITNSRVPLCILGLQSSGRNVVALLSTSQITAQSCLVQSDSDLLASGNSAVRAGAVRTVGAAVGDVAPTPLTDAPTVPDPFSALAID